MGKYIPAHSIVLVTLFEIPFSREQYGLENTRIVAFLAIVDMAPA